LKKEGRAPFEFILEFDMQLRNSAENISQFSRVVWRLLFAPPWPSFRVSLGWPAENKSTSVTMGDFSQFLVGTSAFQFAELRSSLHHLILS
jgi:hypothetical protein